MKNLVRALFLSLFAVCGLVSCSDNDEPHNWPPVLQDTVSSTVLVYMVGQNDLSGDLTANISDMMLGMKNAPYGGNWLVYLDNSTAPELYQLVRDGNGNVTKRTLLTYPDQYSTDVTVMQEVINDVFARFPAENYGLILSSHADGWFKSPRKIQPRAFGQEKASNGLSYYMDITDMADALAQVPHLKYILFDACLMGGVEVAYEFRHVADYMVTSPGSVINLGFPYNTIVPNLLKMTESDFSLVLNRYYTEYQNYFGTLSLVRLGEMEHLAAAFQTLMRTESGLARANTVTRQEMQTFEPDFPIYDFGQLVDSLGLGNRAATDLVKAALAKAIPYKVHTKYSTINVSSQVVYNEIHHYSGLSSYIPVSGEFSKLTFYKELDWFEASGWNLSDWFR